jgi:uncharacterized protein YbjT (DUF2867 family)
MDVVVAGGHGKVGLRLLKLLAERGDRARGLIRKPEQSGDIEDAGAEAVVCDIENEDDLAPYVEGADAVVFAAGAGPGSGEERKRTVDLGGAVKLVEAADSKNVPRYVMVSSIGAHEPSSGPEKMRPYLEAKAEADRFLAQSDLDWTIVRPGMLTNDDGTGKVKVTDDPDARDEVSRDDVAATLAAVLHEPNTIGKTFIVVRGSTPIDDALASL